MQLHLTFLDVPAPEPDVWKELNEAQRTVVIEALARLIAQAAVAEDREEEDHD